MAGQMPPIYRKRRWLLPLIRMLCLLLVLLFFLSVLALAGFRKYIAYTDSGKLYLDIPWLYGYMQGPPAEDPLADVLTVPSGQQTAPILQQGYLSSSRNEEESTALDVTDASNTADAVDAAAAPAEALPGSVKTSAQDLP